MKEHTLTKGSVGRGILLFVLPIIVGSLIQQLYVTIDAVVVGQFTGKLGLAAIDSVHTLFKFPLNFMNGLASGATILISGHCGSGDERQMHCSIRTACTVAVILGVVCSIGGVILTPWMLHIMAVPEEVYGRALAYTCIYFGGIWSMVLYNMAAGILRAYGDSKRPLYVLICCAAINIVGDLLLVGVLHLGVAGAALATVASQIVSVVLTFTMLRKTLKINKDERPLWWPHFCAEHMSQMIRLGFPLALQAMLFPIANSVVQAGVNTMGTDQIAAWGICDKLNMLIWLMSDSMGPALTTFTAQNLGAKNPERIRKGIAVGTSMSAGAVALISVGLFFFARILTPLFVSSQDAASLGVLVGTYSRMMAPFFFFYAIAEALSGACCGTGDTMRPMITTLLTICLLRVIGILAVLPMYGTMECIVMIYIASWIAAGISFLLLWRFDVSHISK
ncbi:MATE family efflux transporter [Clostridiaceae bacterium Marseille-Q4145]|nr:MATE family efflux transporter [Clostridiaceae bacterium Marseille-Q4145]